MSLNDVAGDSLEPLVLPFPDPGPIIDDLYRELETAASGSDEEIRALGDPRLLPRPWAPASCRDPLLQAELRAWLQDVVAWLNGDYTWDPSGLIPGCWPHHPHLVHELAVLADQRRRAGQALTSDDLEHWHRYALPGFTDRMLTRCRRHCDEGHQPSPSVERRHRY